MAAVLIADNDPLTIDLLPSILSDHLSDIVVDVCTSAEDLSCTLKLSTYDTIAISPILLQGNPLRYYKADRHLLTPFLVTVGPEDRKLASRYLENDAFDLLAKPLIPQDAVHTVRLALWQSALLRLVTSKERATVRFREHMEAFPHALKAQEGFESLLGAYERTVQALSTSLNHLLSSEEEHSFFDMAGFVESMTRKRALDRLLVMSEKGTTH